MTHTNLKRFLSSHFVCAALTGASVALGAGMVKVAPAYGNDSIAVSESEIGNISPQFVTVVTRHAELMQRDSVYIVDVFVSDNLVKSVRSQRQWADVPSLASSSVSYGLQSEVIPKMYEEVGDKKGHMLLSINRMIVKLPEEYTEQDRRDKLFEKNGWSIVDTMEEKNTYLVQGDFINQQSIAEKIGENYNGLRGEELEFIHNEFSASMTAASLDLMDNSDVVYAIPATSIRSKLIDLTDYPNFVTRLNGKNPLVNRWADYDYAARVLMGNSHPRLLEKLFIVELNEGDQKNLPLRHSRYSFKLPPQDSNAAAPNDLRFDLNVTPSPNASASLNFSVPD